MKEYKGIKWNGSNRSLCIALNKSESAFASYCSHHPDATQEDYIDFCLGDAYVKKEYRGIQWIDGNYSNLCRTLKRPTNAFFCYKKTHPEATVEDYIDFCLDKNVRIIPDIIAIDKKDEKILKKLIGKYGKNQLKSMITGLMN